MTERTDAQRETVRLYQNNTLDGDSQAAQITLGKAINEYGQSTGSLQAQGGCMQPTHCSPHAWKQPDATAVMSGALSLPRLFLCSLVRGIRDRAAARGEPPAKGPAARWRADPAALHPLPEGHRRLPRQ